jgi:hypothetical protein
MGYSTGGLILKNAARLTDNDILVAARRETFSRTEPVGISDASSESFRATAIGRVGDMAFVFNKDIPHGCSFEEYDLSKMDERLAALSTGGDILCFLINDNSATYAYSIFQEGARVRAMSTAAGMDISDFGKDTGYESNKPGKVANMMEVIDKFIGQSFMELTAENNIQATAYYK